MKRWPTIVCVVCAAATAAAQWVAPEAMHGVLSMRPTESTSP